MAASVPPTELIRHSVSASETQSAISDPIELFPDEPYAPPGLDLTPPPTATSRSSEQAPEGYIVGGIMMLVMAFVFGAMGAPAVMVAGVVIFAMISFAWYFITKRQQVDRYYRQQMEAQEAEERLKNQIADAVKERLKTSIMVRCRYCGSLNDEKTHKCDSCGATL